MVEALRAGERQFLRRGRRDPHERARLGGERAHRELFRPQDGLQELQEPSPRRQPHRGTLQGQGQSRPNDQRGDGGVHQRAPRLLPRLRQVRLDADTHLQPDVRDLARRHRREPEQDLPASRDGAGRVRQLFERAAHDARQGPLRHRADRQGVPQRDHARKLHLPHDRVRTDGTPVVLQGGHGQRVLCRIQGARMAVPS